MGMTTAPQDVVGAWHTYKCAHMYVYMSIPPGNAAETQLVREQVCCHCHRAALGYGS